MERPAMVFSLLLGLFLYQCISVDLPSSRRNKVLIAAILPRDKKWLFSISKVSPAVDIALLGARLSGLLDGCEVVVKYQDSKCNGKDAPIQAFKMYMENSKKYSMLFLGPVCDYALAPVARYAPYWSIPVLSSGGLAHDFGLDKSLPGAEFPTLTRVGTTFEKLAEAVISVIKHHKWKKLKVIYDVMAYSDVSPKFCFLATAAIIHYMTNDTEVQQDFHLISNAQNLDAEHVLKNEIGTDYSATYGEIIAGCPDFNVFFKQKLLSIIPLSDTKSTAHSND